MYAGLVQLSVCTTLAQMFAWVSIAPFGVPVVPPVYCRTATSCGSIGTRGRSAAVTATSRSASARVPSMCGGSAAAAEYSASDVTMTCSIAVCARTACTSGASASSVITRRTPESAATVITSRAV